MSHRLILFALSVVLTTGVLRAQDTLPRHFSAELVQRAVDLNAPRWKFVEPRRYREMPETFGLQITALAAHAAPAYEVNGRPLADHLAAKLRHFLVTPEPYPDGTTREPEALGGIGGWTHHVPANALLLAKHTPAVWNQLSADEHARADLLMQALALAGHWCLDDDNNYYVLMDGVTLFHRSWNPNHVEGYVGVMVAASLYFGPDELNAFFRSFDFDRFTARLEAANFRNILRCWTWTPALRDRMMFGGDLAVPDDQILVPGLVTTGRGVRNTFSFDGMGLDEPWALYRSQAMRVFNKAVRNEVNIHGDLTGHILGEATGATTSPWNGQTGFIFEFESMDWSGLRTNLAYAFEAAMIDLMTATTLKELNEWQLDAGGRPLERRMAVGMADFIFRAEEGYAGWANGKPGNYDWEEYFLPKGADLVIDLWRSYFEAPPPPTPDRPLDIAVAANVGETQTLFADPEVYAAWPTMVQLPDGTLVISFCATEEHLGPNGRAMIMRSTDNGHTWSDPVVAVDTPLDDRENGLTVGPDGTLALHVRSVAWTRAAYDALAPGSYPDETLARWSDYVEQPAYRAAADQAGTWIYTSTDGGHTWSEPVPGPDSIHGGIVLEDGTWMSSAYRDEKGSVALYTAPAANGPWSRIQRLDTPNTINRRFGEPHLAQLPSGRLVMAIRSTASPYDDHNSNNQFHVSVSDDLGKTWSTAANSQRWGYPVHVITLSDGRLLASYGYRRPPYGIRASLSTDGINWTDTPELVLRSDAPNHDLGYPASVEIAPGEILTIYYIENTLGDRPIIQSTRWHLE
ncbi:sialidase family protein [Actomonas aquatica]|uniref:Sialidase family protein n=1 Tax=Actomonas aquatica TaxID=2866162 RepID=A0ABZ1CDF9_9BACT|nr:sialidase family protein [Opitutus sp. WL0086]WRQ89599.1 sialidase family protein [Opitutus sp. WL0086]